MINHKIITHRSANVTTPFHVPHPPCLHGGLGLAHQRDPGVRGLRALPRCRCQDVVLLLGARGRIGDTGSDYRA
jgi:hypothetical protein